MTSQYESSIVRLRTQDGKIVGAGFLVADSRVITCAHVVEQALGLSHDVPDAPQVPINIDFPLVAAGKVLTAHVQVWHPILPGADGGGDIAVLKLDSDPPVGAQSTSLLYGQNLWDHRFRAFGFPIGQDGGVWSDGKIKGAQSARWLQIEAERSTGYRIQRGFSGAPIWDMQLTGVVGMAVAAETQTEIKAAFIIPSEVLVEILGPSFDFLLEVQPRDRSLPMYDFEDDHDVEQCVKACRETHLRGDYVEYYRMLKRYSLPLKKKGRHKELSRICEIDVYRKFSDNLYPTLTYSQSKLVVYDLREAFDSLNQWIQKDPRLERSRPLTRLTFFRTYCEILNADGAYDMASGILETFLASRSIERVRFKALCQATGVLGRSYLGKEDIPTALDLFEATLVEQSLTADIHGIAIARMNLGTAYLAGANHIDARNMFDDAMEAFRGSDDRAYAWAQLNLALALMGTEESENIEELVMSALDYYATHGECSLDYQSSLGYLAKRKGFDGRIANRVESEFVRVSATIERSHLSSYQLLCAERVMSVLDLQHGSFDNASTRNRTVTSGGFKARSTIVRSFKKSLNTDRAVEYLQTIESNPNHFAIPFYNDFVVEICRRRKDLIQEQVIQKLDAILIQTDSIKIFYATFFESERLYDVCEKLLNDVQNKKSYEYLNLQANLYSHYGARYFDMSMDTYAKALDATEIGHYQARIYNNMAHLIHRHRRRNVYDTAIDYCKQSITLRSTVRFFYPSALMLVLRIELANIGDIGALVGKHRGDYGLKDFEIKEILKLLYDEPKKKMFREYAAS